MAALTGPYDARPKVGDLIAYPLAANTKIYKGALVALNAGYAQPAHDDPGVQFVGVAHETKDNAGGAAGAVSVRVQKNGAYTYAKAGAAPADAGKPVFVVDDNTVSTAATANSLACGHVTEVPDSAHVRVRINRSVQ